MLYFAYPIKEGVFCMGLPVINVRRNRSKKLFVSAPEIGDELDDELNDELKVFDKDFLIAALEEAERCTVTVTPEEHWARIDEIING